LKRLAEDPVGKSLERKLVLHLKRLAEDDVGKSFKWKLSWQSQDIMIIIIIIISVATITSRAV
jgi:hypothetical protein